MNGKQLKWGKKLKTAFQVQYGKNIKDDSSSGNNSNENHAINNDELSDIRRMHYNPALQRARFVIV